MITYIIKLTFLMPPVYTDRKILFSTDILEQATIGKTSGVAGPYCNRY